MRALSSSALLTEATDVRPSRRERRAAARGRQIPGDVARSTPLPGRGRNVVHDRSRYAVPRRG